MASAPVPLTNVGSGYTIVTQVIPSSTAQTTAGQNSTQTLSPLSRFLKGEPKALGTVQIMNGLWMMAMGVGAFLGYSFWGPLFHILAGSLTVSASRKMNPCAVKAALTMNILSAIAAGISIIMIILQLIFLRSYWRDFGHIGWSFTGVSVISLVFTLLQFAISISLTVFACKATCSKEPVLNIINVVPDPEAYVPVENSIPVQPGISSFNTAAMNRPVESPPAYSEIKDELEERRYF